MLLVGKREALSNTESRERQQATEIDAVGQVYTKEIKGNQQNDNYADKTDRENGSWQTGRANIIILHKPQKRFGHIWTV